MRLCLIRDHAIKTSKRVEVWLHALLTSSAYGGGWSASLWASVLGTHLTQSWTTVGLKAVIKHSLCQLVKKSNPWIIFAVLSRPVALRDHSSLLFAFLARQQRKLEKKKRSIISSISVRLSSCISGTD
jgi:hypothetical protein